MEENQDPNGPKVFLHSFLAHRLPKPPQPFTRASLRAEEHFWKKGIRAPRRSRVATKMS